MNLENVICCVIDYEPLEEQLKRIDDLCAKVSDTWNVEVNYSVTKGAIVCDIHDEWLNGDSLYKRKTLDETERILTEKAKEKEVEREYIKNVFAEATEIVVQRCTKFIELVSSDRDRIDTDGKIEGWEYDFSMNTKERSFYHLKGKNCWVYSRYENGGFLLVDALNGEVVAMDRHRSKEVQL